MKPKPCTELHRPLLVRVLSAALERFDTRLAGWLEGDPDRFSLVSWTSHLYSEHRDLALDMPGIERLLASHGPTADDRAQADAIGRRLARLWHLLGDSYPWLTPFVASTALKQTLREVHRYLDNHEGIADSIRSMLRAPLLAAWESGAEVVLIGHSLGSVIAYDTLWELSRRERVAGRVGLFLTLGSPIATRFIRLGLLGRDRHGAERYPGNIDRWSNFSAHGELVALHPRIAPFFSEMVELGLVSSIIDRDDLYVHFRGDGGLDVHKSYGYLHHPAVAEAVATYVLRDGG